VPRRQSYTERLKRVGHLSADLVVCDTSSQVTAVVLIQGARPDERSGRRQARLLRVLEAAGVRTMVWQDGVVPAPAAIRQWMKADEVHAPPALDEPSGPMPLEPREPPPSTWFDEFDAGAPAPSPQPGHKP
jgi:hypothetical protein